MNPDFTHQLAALQRQTVAALRERYAELFGEPTRAGNRAWLIKRIAWRLQALAEGDLSQRARERALELARDADLRLCAPRATHPVVAAANALPKAPSSRTHDPRLPPPGSLLRRPYKGMILQVQVQEDTFVFDGQRYPSLSAVAKAITGSHCNGFLFFRLIPKGAAS
ncbi:MAG TPA: DUF2924 domain-containing protein [Gemmataceae bacterium]|jgi:hypothetical protein|nr:DUF2924 domain-containing protein [Gemmataceae bacterium]